MSPEVVDDFIASELSVICADFEKRVTNLLYVILKWREYVKNMI